MQTAPFAARVKQLQATLTDTGLLITNPTDIEYYTGLIQLVPVEREMHLLVSATDALLVHSAFTAVSSVPSLIRTVVGIYPHQITQEVQSFCEQHQLSELWVDQSCITVTEYQAITATDVSVTKYEQPTIKQARARKDVGELEKIAAAGRLTQQIFTDIQHQLNPGMTELDVAQKIQIAFLEHGGMEAFPTIVAFGEHTALPHHQPSSKILEQNMPVLIDMGMRYQRYCADLTRTWWFGGQPTQQFLELEELVRAAYEVAIETITRAGFEVSVLTTSEACLSPTNSQQHERHLSYKEIDHAARTYLKDAGYQKEFCHTTGHGLGLDIHEYPSVSSRVESIVAAPVAITIEPGLYIKDTVGYRHENTIVIE